MSQGEFGAVRKTPDQEDPDLLQSARELIAASRLLREQSKRLIQKTEAAVNKSWNSLAIAGKKHRAGYNDNKRYWRDD